MNKPANTPTPGRPVTFRQLLKSIHDDDAGTVTLETVLLLGAIAIPILIIVIKFGWPKVKGYFDKGMQDLETQTDSAISGS